MRGARNAVLGVLGAYVVAALLVTWGLLASLDPVRMLTGIAIVALPALLGWWAWRRVRMVVLISRMTEILRAEGGSTMPERPRQPTGRPIRDGADVRFTFVMRDVERYPGDWRTWFRLGLALRDSRDGKRSRRAMRQAAALFEQSHDAERHRD
ncbi:MAG: hypothetical protein KGP12_11190 [Actinomycetales bacterium]|nr:hypothetical protein [Actinomycetales bacterium]